LMSSKNELNVMTVRDGGLVNTEKATKQLILIYAQREERKQDRKVTMA
jgi:hypothetical protein